LVLAGVALVGASPSATASVVEESSTLRATGDIGTTVTGAGQVAVNGDTRVDVDVVRAEGGRVEVVAGPDASLPQAWRFPSYSPAGSYPRAVLALTSTSGDGLSPGSSDFAYGAVFRLDEDSSGRALDNGDNVFQRGRFGDSSVFKLQVDHGRPSCLFRGAAGRVLVRSSVEVSPDRWYRAVCSRLGSKVTVAVRSYGDADSTVVDASDGTTGTLSLSAAQAASIGGKLSSAAPQIADANDQFNGDIAKVWLDRTP
jgi:hypothetical protein